MASINVRGLWKKETLHQLDVYIRENKRNVILLQELITQHNNEKNEITEAKKREIEELFSDFNFHYTNKSTAILYHKALQVKPIVVKSKEKLNGNQWLTWIIIYSNNRPILIGSYYRSPSEYSTDEKEEKHAANCEDIRNEIKIIKKLYKDTKFNDIIICGDFNIHSNIWDAYYEGRYDKKEENVLKLLNNNDFELCNKKEKPTHCIYNRDENNIPIINEYNTVDLTIATNTIAKKICNWDTNSHTIYTNENDKNNPYNNELDAQCINDVSDHFAISFDIKLKFQFFLQ